MSGGDRLPDPRSFLSGSRGEPGGPTGRLARRVADAALDARLAAAGRRLDAVAGQCPVREVMAVSVYRPGGRLLAPALAELRRSRHAVRVALGSMSQAQPDLAADTVADRLSGGKFENLNAILEAAPPGGADWVLVLDDDVSLPRRFLDRLLGLAERFDLSLAQPAQALTSYAAWPMTRRRWGSLLRLSRFVEIGPVTLLRRDALGELTPFPPLRYGWGLDLHWAAVAGQRGWRVGIADAVPVRHEQAPVAAAYSSEEAIEEARRFLSEHPFLDSRAVRETTRVLP